MKILWVEDEHSSYAALEDVIKEDVNANVTFEVAPNAEKALQLLEEDAATGLTYELVILDLQIPKSKGTPTDTENGFQVLREVRNREYPCPVVVYSNFATETKEIEEKIQAQREGLFVDEWLSKQDADDRDLMIEKFSPFLFDISDQIQILHEKLGLIAESIPVRRVVRQLSLIAQRTPARFGERNPLPVVLFEGSSGSGKTMFAKALWWLLPDPPCDLALNYGKLTNVKVDWKDSKERRPLLMENAGNFLSETAGAQGAMTLFGGRESGSIMDAAGVIERSSYYLKYDSVKKKLVPAINRDEQLAESNMIAAPEAAGVVFLDECESLDIDTQTRLNTMFRERGSFTTIGKPTPLNGAVYFIMATNARVDELAAETDEAIKGERGVIRRDILNRVTDRVMIPALWQHPEDWEAIFRGRAEEQTGTPARELKISQDVVSSISDMINEKILNVEDLVKMAICLQPGTKSITHGNVASVLELVAKRRQDNDTGVAISPPSSGAGSRSQSGDQDGPKTLKIGPIEVRLTEWTCWVNGSYCELSEQLFNILAMLMKNQGEVLGAEHFKTVFGGSVPPAGTLRQAIRRLREKLNGAGLEEDYILTVTRVGFKFRSE